MSEDVIIVGVTHHNTLGTIRSIGEGNTNLSCTLILYGEKESYLSFSKYVNKTYYVDSSKEVVNLLLSIKKDKKQIIITVTDEAAYQLDINAELLDPYFIFFRCNTPGQLTNYMDKSVQDNIAEEVGLNVPLNYESNNINYPCILKPIASMAGGKKLLICENHDDYQKTISQYKDIEFQIQQYIRKEQEIVLVGISINGEVHIPAYILKHREILGGTTYSSVYPIKDLDHNIVNKSKQMIKSMGYEGLFGIEYILCNDKYYFIEINLRNDATSYAVTKAGVNLQIAYVYAKLNKDYMPILNMPIQKINSMVEFRDFDFVMRRNIGLLKWISQRNHCECLYFYNKEDRKPYMQNYKIFKKSLIKAITNKFLKCIKIK